MTVLRVLGNLILAIILIALMIAVMFTGYAIVVSQAWENASIDYGVETGAWATIGGQSIYYRLVGNEADPCVVLIHDDSVEGLQTWAGNIEELNKAGVRVLAIDLVGYGHSAREGQANFTPSGEAAIVAKVIEQVGLKGGIVVGHGRGSAVALKLAQEQPQWIKSIALVSPVIYTQSKPIWQDIADVPYLGRAAVWAWSSGGPLWTMRRSAEFYNRAAASRTYLAQIVQPTHVVGTLDAVLAINALRQEDEPGTSVSAVKVPALILLGREDRSAAVADGKRLASEIPNARVVTVPEAGYFVHIEQSAQVTRAIAEFCLATPR